MRVRGHVATLVLLFLRTPVAPQVRPPSPAMRRPYGCCSLVDIFKGTFFRNHFEEEYAVISKCTVWPSGHCGPLGQRSNAAHERVERSRPGVSVRPQESRSKAVGKARRRTPQGLLPTITRKARRSRVRPKSSKLVIPATAREQPEIACYCEIRKIAHCSPLIIKDLQARFSAQHPGGPYNHTAEFDARVHFR